MKFLSLLFLSTISCFGATISGSGSITGSGFLTSGNVAPSKANSPSPANGATHQALDGVTLSWGNGGGATTYDVWVGQSGTMTKVSAAQAGLTYAVTNTFDGETVHWRIDAINATGMTTGDEWTYTIVTPAVGQLLLTMEAGSVGDLLTTNLLNTATSAIANFGVWTVSANGALAMQVSNVQQTLYTPVRVGGTNYLGTGTRSVQVYANTNTATAIYQWTTNQTKVAWRAYVSFGESTDSNGGQMDHIDIWSTGGQFCVCQIQIGTSQNNVRAHAKGASSLFGANIAITPGTIYEVRARYTQNGSCELKLLSAADSTLIGSSTVGPGDGILSDEALYFFQFGMGNNHSLTRPNLGVSQYDNFIVAVGDDADTLFDTVP